MDKRTQIINQKLQIDALIALAKEQPGNKRAFLEIFSNIVKTLIPEAAVDVTIERIHEAERVAEDMKEWGR